MKASDKRKRARGRYFIAGWQMRESKWFDSCHNSQAKREGKEKPVITHIVCGCGCGVMSINKDSKVLVPKEKKVKKTKKEVIYEK